MANNEFIGMMLPYAMEASKATGVDPRIILAQAALESNWGKSAPGNNYFGVKSHGASGGNTLSTTEVINGKPVTVQDSFRAYGGPRESALGYADFINRNPRYEGFRTAQGIDAQIDALGKSGYATDPLYAQKISSIAKGIDAPNMVASADGPKGQEAYPAPVMGSMAVAQAPNAPASSPAIPPAVAAAAAPGSGSKLNDIFGMMAMGGQQGPQFSPVNIQGPSAEQANALSSLIQALKGRLA
ncbi:putative N-acetylmuramoyl-L-alanine amidase lysozyme-like protein [Rhizobium phage RHph_Y1_10]|nr:putative N-acetylmuramoyl-L-alanine amidase lysozyme-like protein [Rhizobium phage RHph_Y1_10]